MKGWRGGLCALLLLTGLVAHAQQTAGGVPAPEEPILPVVQEELYIEALRSLDAGHPEEASEMLKRFIEKEPRHAGAWLDLALSQCELGHAAEAERLFHEIEVRFNPPPGIMEVIQQRRAEGCKGVQARPFSLSVSVGRGHDSNVNQGASNATFSTGTGSSLVEWELSPDYLPQPDYYSQVGADYIQPLDSSGTVAVVQLRSRRHDTIHAQDTDSLLLGLEHPWQWGKWQGRATLALGAVRLGNELYQRQEQLQLRVSPPVTLPEHFDWSLTGGFSHVAYPTRSEYDANTLELSSMLSWRKEATLVQLSAGALSDHGQVTRPGGDRTGWYAGAQWYGPLGKYVNGEFGVTHQIWHSDALYSPGLIDTYRHQDTDVVRAALVVPLMQHHSLLFEWRETRNKENISLFQYNSRMLQLSWRWDNF